MKPSRKSSRKQSRKSSRKPSRKTSRTPSRKKRRKSLAVRKKKDADRKKRKSRRRSFGCMLDERKRRIEKEAAKRKAREEADRRFQAELKKCEEIVRLEAERKAKEAAEKAEASEIRRQQEEERAKLSAEEAERKRVQAEAMARLEAEQEDLKRQEELEAEQRLADLNVVRVSQTERLRQARDEIDELRKSIADVERRESYRSQFLPISQRIVEKRRRSSVNQVDRFLKPFPELEYKDGSSPSLDNLYCHVNERLRAMSK